MIRVPEEHAKAKSEAWVGSVVTGRRGLKHRNGAGRQGLKSRKDVRFSEGYRKAVFGVPKGVRITRSGSEVWLSEDEA